MLYITVPTDQAPDKFVIGGQILAINSILLAQTVVIVSSSLCMLPMSPNLSHCDVGFPKKNKRWLHLHWAPSSTSAARSAMGSSANFRDAMGDPLGLSKVSCKSMDPLLRQPLPLIASVMFHPMKRCPLKPSTLDPM